MENLNQIMRLKVDKAALSVICKNKKEYLFFKYVINRRFYMKEISYYILFPILVVFLQFCKDKNYIIINNNKFTESDLKNSMPIQYYKLKDSHSKELQRLFQHFSDQKIIELESKEKGVKLDQVLTQGFVEYDPSEQEIQEVYEKYKEQIDGTKSKEELRKEIITYLKSVQLEAHKDNLMNNLREKYKVSIQLEEVEKYRVNLSEKGNPALGVENAKITIIEFSDFECPYCKKSQEVNRQLREKYKDKIRWVFRDFPLPSHENAMLAHVAANCTIPQNKYWNYFNLLFENSENLTKDVLLKLATNIGVDMKKFEDCISNSEKIKEEIQADIEDGKSIEVNGTPVFIINGIIVEGAQPLEHFESIIEKELK